MIHEDIKDVLHYEVCNRYLQYLHFGDLNLKKFKCFKSKSCSLPSKVRLRPCNTSLNPFFNLFTLGMCFETISWILQAFGNQKVVSYWLAQLVKATDPVILSEEHQDFKVENQ